MNSIEKYRKQQKQAKIKRRVTVILIILALVLIIVSVNQVFKRMTADSQLPTYDAAELSKGFPITMPTSATYRLELMGDDISLLTDTGLYVYNDEGNRILSFSHAYNSPISETNSTRTLVYDAGGKQFLCATRKAVVFQNTLADKIMLGKISKSGKVAIVTDSDRYASVLYVYDTDGKEVYSVSVTEKIIDCEFAPDNNSFIISTVSAIDGEVYSMLSCYKFSNTKGEEWKTKLNGSVVMDINAFSGSNVTAVADNAIYTVKNGEVVNSQPYANVVSDIAVSENMTAVLLDDSGNRQKRLLSVNKNGNLICDTVFENNVFDICISGSSILAFNGKNVIKYNENGTETGSAYLNAEYKYFTSSSKNVYLLSDTVIGRTAIADIKARTENIVTETETQTDKPTESESSDINTDSQTNQKEAQ